MAYEQTKLFDLVERPPLTTVGVFPNFNAVLSGNLLKFAIWQNCFGWIIQLDHCLSGIAKSKWKSVLP